MKFTLKTEVYSIALADGRIKTKAEIKRRSGLNYATVLKLCNGLFTLNAFNKIIGRYFSALGLKANEVREAQVKDLFDVEE